MKKTIYLILSLAYICESCDEGEDSGRTTSTFIEIENTSGNEVILSWYTSSISNNLDTIFSIKNNESLILYQSGSFGSNIGGERGLIYKEPYNDNSSYDSVKMMFPNDTISYLFGDCHVTQNPLCLENYEVIKDVDNKDLKALELRFVIE